jgi:DnaJ family protein A protein 2
LTDEKKRKIYDQRGEEGLDGPLGPGNSPFDIFHEREAPGPRKAKSVLQVIEVTLSEVYCGAKKKMTITRNRICKECNGLGGKEGSVSECKRCGGAGRRAKVIQMGMMISQTISVCDECRGRGKVIKDKCVKCKGKGVVEDTKILDIVVEKGTPDGHRFKFEGEADEYVKIINIKFLAWNRSRRCIN